MGSIGKVPTIATRIMIVLGALWSVLAGAGTLLMMAVWGAFAKGQLIGGGGWQQEHTNLVAVYLVLEIILLVALVGAFRLRKWACLTLTTGSVLFLIVYLLLPQRGQLFASILAFFLFPACPVAALLGLQWRHLQSGL